MKTLAEILRGTMEAEGYAYAKDYAADHGIPYEEFRKVLSGAFTPADKTLRLYAEMLWLDEATLILTAYWQRAPETVKPLLEPLVEKQQREMASVEPPTVA